MEDSPIASILSEPAPSGRMPARWAYGLAAVLAIASVAWWLQGAFAERLNPWILPSAVAGLLILTLTWGWLAALVFVPALDRTVAGPEHRGLRLIGAFALILAVGTGVFYSLVLSLFAGLSSTSLERTLALERGPTVAIASSPGFFSGSCYRPVLVRLGGFMLDSLGQRSCVDWEMPMTSYSPATLRFEPDEDRRLVALVADGGRQGNDGPLSPVYVRLWCIEGTGLREVPFPASVNAARTTGANGSRRAEELSRDKRIREVIASDEAAAAACGAR